jgi:hypothetical protein
MIVLPAITGFAVRDYILRRQFESTHLARTEVLWPHRIVLRPPWSGQDTSEVGNGRTLMKFGWYVE